VIKDAVQGLVYLHDLKLIHLDIKPKNILVSYTPALYVAIAKLSHYRINIY